MIDYNKPWGWAPQAKQTSNMIAPLGGQEADPGVVQGGPSQQDKMMAQLAPLASKAAGDVASGITKSAASGGSGNAAQAGFRAAELAADSGGAVTGAANVLPGAAEAATEGMASGVGGSAASAAPGLGIGLAVADAFRTGEYDQAAGKVAGMMAGSAVAGPLGGIIGAQLGGMAGNAVGGMLGLADGTEKVPEKKGLVTSLWEALSKSRSAQVAVKASTGNDGKLGEAKQALSGRAKQIEDAEKKALGYANGTTGAGGGKGFGPTNYYGELNQAYNPVKTGSGQVNQNAPQFNPWVPQKPVQQAPVQQAPQPVWAPDNVAIQQGGNMSTGGTGVGSDADGASAGSGGGGGGGGGK